MKLRELIEIFCRDIIYPSATSTFWKDRNFFRLGLPRWFHRMTVGVGIDDPVTKILRLKMLLKRYNREIIIPGPIPLRESEVKRGNKIRATSTTDVNEFIAADHPVKTRFLKRVRAYQILRKAQLSRPKHVDQFVAEARFVIEDAPELIFLYLFQNRRPLNPYRVNRLKNAVSLPEKCRLLVQVSRALNLPSRKLNASGKQDLICPFVEVVFQKRRRRTETKMGQNPQWNEMIKLDIIEDDFSPENLMESDISSEVVYINLFDEFTVDILEDQRTREQFKHERIQKIFLGSMSIPFATIWQRCRVDGAFPIEIPISLQQYDLKADPQTSVIIPSVLHIFITLDPPLLQPPPLDVQFETEEDAKLIRYAESWVASVAGYGRNIVALCQNMSGKTIFIPRFIRPQPAPKTLKTDAEIVRFVSLIPFVPNRSGFGASCNLWSTSDQVLEVGSGDSVEHAIILCNFFLARDIPAWVLLGEDLIDGNSAYVLIESTNSFPIETSLKPSGSFLRPDLASIGGLFRFSKASLNTKYEYQIYHPVTGKIYNTNDRYCPLVKVGCIFNAENVTTTDNNRFGQIFNLKSNREKLIIISQINHLGNHFSVNDLLR